MADRPIECSQCQRPLAVDYTESVGGHKSQLSMCSVCPVLQQKLHGHIEGVPASGEGIPTSDLACGQCGTTLEAVRTGSPLGCPACYEVFGDIIVMDLLHEKRISPRMGRPTQKSTQLHIGRAPGEAVEISPAIQLFALNEALDESLKREDYERAAWLRDRISKLKENLDESA